MDKKEKFLKFLNPGTIPEYIPFHPILMHFAARRNNSTYAEFASDHRILVQSNIRALKEFDLDWVELISDPYRETAAFGAKIKFIPEGVPVCLSPIVKTIEDVHNLKNPDIYSSPRTQDRIAGAELYQKLLKGSVPVFGWVEGPLAEACSLVGVSNMLMMLMTDPNFCDFLMDKCLITAKDFAKAQIEAGCDVIGIGDAICSQIDPEVYNKFVKERHRELTRYIQSLGGKVKIHICGNITHLLPSLKEVGPDILDIDWEVSFSDAFNYMGNTTAICGNINPVTIQDAEKNEIAEITNTLVQENSGKRLIMSGGCEITVSTQPEKLAAMKDVLRKYEK